jgi:hypothetical protein
MVGLVQCRTQLHRALGASLVVDVIVVVVGSIGGCEEREGSIKKWMEI